MLHRVLAGSGAAILLGSAAAGCGGASAGTRGAATAAPANAAPTTATAATTRTTTNPRRLPLGDGRVSTAGARRGYVFVCQQSTAPGGANVDGPWIHGRTF